MPLEKTLKQPAGSARDQMIDEIIRKTRERMEGRDELGKRDEGVEPSEQPQPETDSARDER